MIDVLVVILFVLVLASITSCFYVFRSDLREIGMYFTWLISMITIIVIVSVFYMSHYDDVYTAIETVLEVLHVS